MTEIKIKPTLTCARCGVKFIPSHTHGSGMIKYCMDCRVLAQEEHKDDYRKKH